MCHKCARASYISEKKLMTYATPHEMVPCEKLRLSMEKREWIDKTVDGYIACHVTKMVVLSRTS